MKDPYLYPNVEVLRNLGDIQDEQELKNMEADYTLYRLSEMVTDTEWVTFDFESLCEMHHYIFQDVYEWAGKPRIMNIEKSEVVLGELSIEYSDCFDIGRDAELILREMNRFDWKRASFDSVVKNFSDFMASLWKVHPYRDDDVIIRTKLEKPSKIKGFALILSLFFMSGYNVPYRSDNTGFQKPLVSDSLKKEYLIWRRREAVMQRKLKLSG